MKKFTILLVAFLAVSSVYTACPAAATDHSLIAQFNVINSGTTTLVPTTAADSAIGTCGATAGNLVKICCVDAEVRKVVEKELTRVKAQYEGFGTAVYRFGAVLAKAASLTTAAANTTIDGITAGDATLGGATSAQIKAFTYYPAATFVADYDLFKGQVADCYAYHAAAVQKVACHACMETTGNAAPWTTLTTVAIKEASCNEWATKCNKVWNFLHKASWLIQSVALINKKVEKTAGAVTFNAPTTPWGYAPGFTTIEAINTAITNCGSGDLTATGLTTCTAAHRADLCKSFIGMFAGTATVAGVLVGRSQTTYIDGTYNPVSQAARRMLAVATSTGAIAIDAAGVDTTATNALIFPPTAAVAALATGTTWSHGYVASTTSSSSSSSTTTKNAKVVIGTILSALFAIAFLN